MSHFYIIYNNKMQESQKKLVILPPIYNKRKI